VAIVELKAVEHPVFLLQAAKYWLPIRRHLEQADFPRYGYFSSVALQANPPLVYLVAPALRFHPTTEICSVICILQVEVVRVGLAESWRRGLCVVLGQSFLVSRIRISPATFACSTGYTSRAFRKVIPREFLRKDSPPEPSVLD